MNHDTTVDTNNDDDDDIMVDCENNDTDSNVIIQTEDAHLLLLGIPIGELLHRLRTDILPLSSARYTICHRNLRNTETMFRLGLSNTKRKKKVLPQIKQLEEYWTDELHPGTIFPSLSFCGSK